MHQPLILVFGNLNQHPEIMLQRSSASSFKLLLLRSQMNQTREAFFRSFAGTLLRVNFAKVMWMKRLRLLGSW